jgi:hypothetical protein
MTAIPAWRRHRPFRTASPTARQIWAWYRPPTSHWFIAGTDLGIMWDSGYIDDATQKPIIYTLFGDSYSDPGMAGDWRNNVLFRTIDTDLNGGLDWNAAVINAGAHSR